MTCPTQFAELSAHYWQFGVFLDQIRAVGLTEAMALEYAPAGVRILSVAPGAFSATGFNAASDNKKGIGDGALLAFSVEAMGRVAEVGKRMSSPDGKPADPQAAADHVFAAVTEPGPIHKPSGKDAEATKGMMGQQNRQEFLDQLLAMLDLQDRESGFSRQRKIAMRLPR